MILKSKKGTTMVEASMILPVVIIAVIAIIHIGVSMYEKVSHQCDNHLVQREEWRGDESDFARKMDLIKTGGQAIE